MALMVFLFLTLKFALRLPRLKRSAVGIKLRCRYFVEQSKIDSARIRLSIPIRCSHLSGVLLNSKKSVQQQLIAKTNSWRTGISNGNLIFRTGLRKTAKVVCQNGVIFAEASRGRAPTQCDIACPRPGFSLVRLET